MKKCSLLFCLNFLQIYSIAPVFKIQICGPLSVDLNIKQFFVSPFLFSFYRKGKRTILLFFKIFKLMNKYLDLAILMTSLVV